MVRREILFSVSYSVKANHQGRGLALMGERARGMERTSTFAGHVARRGQQAWGLLGVQGDGQEGPGVGCRQLFALDVGGQS